MNKLFVDYELSYDLKIVGFNKKCFAYYNDDKTLQFVNSHDLHENEWYETVSAPVHQQVLDWFREEHNIFIELSIGQYPNTFNVFIPRAQHGYIYSEPNIRATFEYYEALNVGFNTALKMIQ